MSTHLLFDLLAYLTSGIVAVLFANTLFRDLPPRVPGKSRLWYWVFLLQGVIVGAFLFGTIELQLSGIPGIGKSILGAIVGGIIVIELYKKFEHIRGSTGLRFVPSLAAGIAVGRWGCFLTGLPDQTHGIPTASALGYDFGDGILRHPVQLYESFAMILFFLVFTAMMLAKNTYWRRNGFYLFIGFYGAQRFAWEFLKPYATLLGPFNLFHLLCAGLFVYAVAMMRSHEHQHLQAR
jgi:phosphatidylglycerol---prolipoprotein diacylglyceryl transferase